ncbi:hypothetical protein D9M71_611590 [compost metagenome]
MVFRRQGGYALLGDVARLAQRLGTVEIQFGAPQSGLVGGDLGLASGNQAGLLGQAAFGLQAFGFAGVEGCAGALHGQAKVVRLQAHQQVALGNMLVVLHQYFIDARTQLTGDPGDFALYIGVVGTFVEASLEVPVGEKGEGNQQDKGEKNQQATLELSRHETIVPKM